MLNFKMAAVNYVLVIVAFLTNAAAIVFGYLNSTHTGGLFNNTIETLSVKYYNEVAPVGIIFAIIWPIIFLWTLGGSLYLLISLCLPLNESPVNITPTLTPKTYFVSYTLGFVCTISWLFTFDQELLNLSFTLLAIGALAFYATLHVSVKLVYDNLAKLEKNSKTMLWVVRILVQNGLGLITTWLTLAASIGFTIALLYVDSPGQTIATKTGLFTVDEGSAMVLSLLLALILVWFVFENFVWEKYLRYLFTTYPVFIFAFSGLVAKLQPHETDRSFIMAAVNLGFSCFLFLARIGLSIYRFIVGDLESHVTDGKARLIEQEEKKCRM